MTCPPNKKMDPYFVKKTLKLIKDYDKHCIDKSITEQNDLKFTLLINCLLGLIVFINEKEEKGLFLQEDIFNIKGIPGIKNELLRVGIKKITLGEFLYHFRNAISHLNIKAVIYNEGSNIRKEIELWDKNPNTNKITLKKIILSYDEVLIISKIISRKYINKK